MAVADVNGQLPSHTSNAGCGPCPARGQRNSEHLQASKRQWVRLGSSGPELSISSISLSDDHIAPSTEIDIDAVIKNDGGATLSPFKVAFFAGDDDEPFASITIAGIEQGEEITVSTTWKAEEVGRIRVEADYGNYIVEVNDNDNSAEHSVDVAYGKYLGWIDSPRENPLTWIFIIITLITLVVVVSVASKTSLDFSDGALQEDFGWEDEEEDYEEYEDEDDEDDDY